MFRIKKTSGAETQEPAAVERPEVVEAEPVVKAPPRRATPVPARPVGSANFPLEVGRRTEIVAGPGRSDPSTVASRDKCLVIGKDVRVKGEVVTCDKLIIEGEAEIAVKGCRVLQIGPAGILRGTVEVAEAEIAGQFIGDLLTRERLTLRASGRLQGKVRYGQITVDAGGQISGDVASLDLPASAGGHPARNVSLHGLLSGASSAEEASRRSAAEAVSAAEKP